MLTLNFVFALFLSKGKFNAIISVTYKFPIQVTLVEDADTWSAKQWAHTFLNRWEIIDWGLPGELITN